MAEATIEKHKSDRHISEHVISSLNLKTEDNLNEYIILIVDEHDQDNLFQDLSGISSGDHLKKFDNIEDSLTFINSIHSKDIFLIISGTLGKIHANKFDSIPQVTCLYVYCMDTNRHAEWTKEIKKIRCVVSNATELLTKLHIDIKQISGRWPLGEKSFKDVETVTSAWYRLFLLAISHPPQCFEQSYCELLEESQLYYKNNTTMLTEIKGLNLKGQSAIKEYTKNSFLYRITNHALRTQNTEIIQKFSPFIIDLHSELYEHYENYISFQTSPILVVYRGQRLTVNEVEYLRSISESKNPIISLTTFGSTSRDPDVAMMFLPASTGYIPCLFEIIITDEYMMEEISPKEPMQVFADISSLSQFPGEQEVLFSLLTHFRVRDVGDRAAEQDYGWLPITFELVHAWKDNYDCHHSPCLKLLTNETDPQNYVGLLNFLKGIAEDQARLNNINWSKWWSTLGKQWGTNAARDQSLLLTFYQCFTEDKHYSRQAVEMHKKLLKTVPKFESNQSNFLTLLKFCRDYKTMPTKQIAIFEQYIEKSCATKTKQFIECLYDVGLTYEKISEKDRALECYKNILKPESFNEFKKYDEVQRRIKKLETDSKKDRLENNDRITLDQDTKNESPNMSEVNQGHGSSYRKIGSSSVHKLSIVSRLEQLDKYVKKFEMWYDAAESRIILHLPSCTKSDFSVNDYRSYFLTAAERHVNSKTTDAANNVRLSHWRYTKYMNAWISFKEMEKVLQTYKKKLVIINRTILPRLERLLKKLAVLITTSIIYICIKQRSHKVNVRNLLSISLRTAETSQLAWFNILDEALLRELKALPELSDAEETSTSIPDDKRFLEVTFTELVESIQQV